MTRVTSLEKQLAATHITDTSDHPIASIGNDLGHIARAMRMTSQSSESSDIVFVCIDCEAFESDQSKVTEVGVAVLDTRDLQELGAPLDQSVVSAKVLSAHYRIVEYADLVNENYVNGCPESFGFGVSTWIRQCDAQRILNRIFQNPSRILDCTKFKENITSSDRKIVLVGHGLGNDERYLNSVGFSLKTQNNLISHADTQRLPGVRMIGLKKLLAVLNIEAVNLHNAGNDAVYTLQALIAMAEMDSRSSGSVPAAARRGMALKPKEKHDGHCAQCIWGGSASPGDERFTTQRKLGGKGRKHSTLDKKVYSSD